MSTTTAERPARSGFPPGILPARSRILLALWGSSKPSAAVRLTLRLARALDAELFVLLVLPPDGYVVPMSGPRAVVDAADTTERHLRAVRSTWAWLAATGGDAIPRERLEIRCGDFVEQVAWRAADVGVDLVVMPPREGRFGSMVTTLATNVGAPVLVARGNVSAETIVAATDLADPTYPVLRRATDLGAVLGASVVAVHNVPPGAFVTDGEHAWPLGAPHDEARVQEERLAIACRACDVEETVVSQYLSAADAILRETRTRDADLVVVGTRHRSWSRRAIGSSVAAHVVNFAGTSVLVTPLAAAKS